MRLEEAERAAERARTLFRELGDKGSEAVSLFMIGQNSVLIAVGEGARVGEHAAGRREHRPWAMDAAETMETVMLVTAAREGNEPLVAEVYTDAAIYWPGSL